jgi:hypothetical protein
MATNSKASSTSYVPLVELAFVAASLALVEVAASELLRTPAIRTSQNTYSTQLGE